jgi:hypothetical protein
MQANRQRGDRQIAAQYIPAPLQYFTEHCDAEVDRFRVASG